MATHQEDSANTTRFVAQDREDETEKGRKDDWANKADPTG